MKLNKNFLIHNTGGETVLVPTGKADFSGIVRGNKTFGAVLEIMRDARGVFTETEIVNAMRKKYDAPEGAVEKDVKKVIEELRKIGAVDD